MDKLLDYNSIEWNDYFYLDESSPSGLKWKVDRKSGKNHTRTMVFAGDNAGTILKTRRRWYVNLNRSYLVHRIIYVLLYGSIDNNLVVDHLDGNSLNNKYENLKLKTHKGNTQNAKKRVDNKSGHVGVSFNSSERPGGPVNSYWTASWCNMKGGQQHKHFSIRKFGDYEAMQLAIEYRDKQIELLNRQGAEYTNRCKT